MKKTTPSKVIINPRPPAATASEESAQDTTVIQPKSLIPDQMPPAPPVPPAEEAHGPGVAAPAKGKVCKTKLPQKPIEK